MAQKLNSEFNYRYQVQGETIWEKIKTLKGFLEGRVRAAALEKVNRLKYEAKKAKLDYLESHNGKKHKILALKADIAETESHFPSIEEAFKLNLEEIDMLKRLLDEAYVIAEPTRIQGYSDEQMFEINAANEFTAMIIKDIHAEILANGRPSPAKLRNAMSNPHTFNALKQCGFINHDVKLLECGNDPLCIEFKSI